METGSSVIWLSLQAQQSSFTFAFGIEFVTFGVDGLFVTQRLSTSLFVVGYGISFLVSNSNQVCFLMDVVVLICELSVCVEAGLLVFMETDTAITKKIRLYFLLYHVKPYSVVEIVYLWNQWLKNWLLKCSLRTSY